MFGRALPSRLFGVKGEGRRKGSRMARDQGRSHSGWILFVEQAYEMAMEINFVRVLGDRFESDQFADKGAPNKTLTASPFDVATVAHPPCVPRARILQWW